MLCKPARPHAAVATGHKLGALSPSRQLIVKLLEISERTQILHNALTKKFVLLFHLDTSNFKPWAGVRTSGHVGVLTADMARMCIMTCVSETASLELACLKRACPATRTRAVLFFGQVISKQCSAFSLLIDAPSIMH